jgi:hypothetical protein
LAPLFLAVFYILVYNKTIIKGVLMISTVTTSTVSTITTTAIAGSVALVGIFVFFALLFQKEVTTTATSIRMKRLGRALNVGIIPLLIAFVLIVVTTVVGILR